MNKEKLEFSDDDKLTKLKITDTQEHAELKVLITIKDRSKTCNSEIRIKSQTEHHRSTHDDKSTKL